MVLRRLTSTGKLSDLARHVILPSGIVSTGWPAVRDKCRGVGIIFDEWQDGLGRAILAKRADGQYAAGIGGVVISISRQTGKTFTIGSTLVALCILFPDLKVVWTAHHGRTSDETFKSLQGMVKRKRIWPHILIIRIANGQQEIAFVNGSRIMFGARESGFGRGFDDVDVLVFDEAQILSQKALENMVPTTNVAPNPLVFLMGTSPKPSDPSEAFSSLRRGALSGELDDVLFVEFSADENADVEDRRQWHKGNPSYPHRTPEASMLRMKRLLGDESFRREGMGVWDNVSGGSRLITADQWSALAVQSPPTDGTKSFGVAFSADGRRVAVSGAMRHGDGVHVEIVGAHSGSIDAGIASLADWLAERWRDTATIVISGRAGAGVLHEALLARKVSAKALHIASTVEYFTACAMFLNDATEPSPSLTHLGTEGQAALDASVAACDKKIRGQGGAWGWVATTTDGDETPIEAASLANWGAKTSKRKPGRTSKAVVMA